MKLKIRFLKNNSLAQGMLEYVTLLTIVALVLGSMRLYFSRGIQSVVKVAADQLGSQSKLANKDLDSTAHYQVTIPLDTSSDETKENKDGYTFWRRRDNTEIKTSISIDMDSD